jgi:hypothetical protein
MPAVGNRAHASRFDPSARSVYRSVYHHPRLTGGDSYRAGVRAVQSAFGHALAPPVSSYGSEGWGFESLRAR